MFKRSASFAAVCLLVGMFAGGMAPRESQARSVDSVYAAKVGFIFDGDTLWVLPAGGGRSRKLRIEGIDAPEICQEGGVAARDALRERLAGQTVTVREHSRDTYGRPLVELALGGEDVAGWMVKQGWAWSHRWRDDAGPYAHQEALARNAKRGVFGARSPEEPRAFRKRNGSCPRR